MRKLIVLIGVIFLLFGCSTPKETTVKELPFKGKIYDELVEVVENEGVYKISQKGKQYILIFNANQHVSSFNAQVKDNQLIMDYTTDDTVDEQQYYFYEVHPVGEFEYEIIRKDGEDSYFASIIL